MQGTCVCEVEVFSHDLAGCKSNFDFVFYSQIFCRELYSVVLLGWLGLAWLGLAWLGLAWLGLAWLDLAWLGLARLGLARLGLASLDLATLDLAAIPTDRHDTHGTTPMGPVLHDDALNVLHFLCVLLLGPALFKFKSTELKERRAF